MKNILLTGGNGFIGRNIKEQLGEKYNIFTPNSTELDLLDKIKLKEYIKKNNISQIIHSAIYNNKRRKINSNGELDANLKMFFNLVEFSNELEKIIYFGSGAEFDKRYSIHMAKEEEFGNKIPLLNDYGLSKYIMNLEARKSNNIYNFRLFGIYGKYEDKENCFPSHLCQCAINDEALTIRQDCLFDFMYIDDLMEPLQWIIENKPKYHDYNICSGNPIYLSKMAEIVKDISGKDLEIVFLNEGENLEYTGANDLIFKEKKFYVTNNYIGLKQLYNYYLERRDTKIL